MYPTFSNPPFGDYSFVRNFHLNLAAGCGGVHGGNDKLHFCRVKKIAVLKLVPSFMGDGADGVAG
jgi:hypothetical protein